MDPNAAYSTMTGLFNAGDYSEAHDVAEGLLGWVLSGGFLPNLDGPTSTRIVAIKCRKLMAACVEALRGTDILTAIEIDDATEDFGWFTAKPIPSDSTIDVPLNVLLYGAAALSRSRKGA